MVRGIKERSLEPFLEEIHTGIDQAGGDRAACRIDKLELYEENREALMVTAAELQGGYFVMERLSGLYVDISRTHVMPGVNKIDELAIANSSKTPDATKMRELRLWSRDVRSQIDETASTVSTALLVTSLVLLDRGLTRHAPVEPRRVDRRHRELDQAARAASSWVPRLISVLGRVVAVHLCFEPCWNPMMTACALMYSNPRFALAFVIGHKWISPLLRLLILPVEPALITKVAQREQHRRLRPAVHRQGSIALCHVGVDVARAAAVDQACLGHFACFLRSDLLVVR